MTGALIDGIVVLDVAAVIPLALGQPGWWAAVTVAVAASLIVPSGRVAAVLAASWLVVAAYGLVGALRIAMTSKVEPVLLANVIAPAFACVAAVARAAGPIGEPTVESLGIAAP